MLEHVPLSKALATLFFLHWGFLPHLFWLVLNVKSSLKHYEAYMQCSGFSTPVVVFLLHSCRRHHRVSPQPHAACTWHHETRSMWRCSKKKREKMLKGMTDMVSGVTSLPLINALMKTKEDRMHSEPETGLSNSAYIWWIRKIFAATNSQGNEILCKLIWWLLGKVVQDVFKGCAWFQELLHLNVALPMGSSCGRMFLSHYSGSADCKWCYKAAISFHIDATHAFLQKVNFFTLLLNASQLHQHYDNIIFLS